MDASVLVGVIVCVLASIILKWFSKRDRFPPGPIGLPVLGYIPFLSRKVYLDFERLAKKYGNVFSLRFGSMSVVVLNDFETTKEAFAQRAFMGRPPDLPFNFNRETIETEAINGIPWMEHRRFSLHMLRDLGFGRTKMEAHILEEINDLLLHLEQKANVPFCISSLLAPSMANNIGSLVFGKRLKYDDPVRQMTSRTLKEANDAVAQVIWQVFFPWLGKICKVLKIGGIDKVARVQKELKDYIKKEMKEHEESLNPNNIRDFIDGYLLEIEKRKEDPSFCKPVLQDLVTIFFGAGSETVRITLEWLLLTAAAYQDGQRHVQQEIDDVIGTNHLPASINQKSMPYTQAFISELMRWRTIIPVNLMRYTLSDGEVKGFVIPKHSYVMSNSWFIHHDREFWGPDADEFRPERFLTDDGQAVKKLEYFMPFSVGKRACPGEPFAKVEVFLYFTCILQKFNIRLPEGKVADLEEEIGAALMPKPQELIFSLRE